MAFSNSNSSGFLGQTPRQIGDDGRVKENPVPSQDTDSGQGDDDDKDKKVKNNNLDDEQFFDNLWEDDKDEGAGGKTPGAENSNNNGNPNNSGSADVNEVVQQHLKDLGIAPISLSEAELEAYRENPEPFLNRIQAQVQEGYLSSLRMVTQQLDNRFAEFKNEFDGRIDEKADVRNIRAALKEELPGIMNNPATAPMAESVAARMKMKGVAADKIPEKVKIYFDRMWEQGNPNANGDPNDRSMKQKSQETNWDEFMQHL